MNTKKSNCISNYKGLNCKDKASCLNRCINEKFLEKYSSLPMYSVIDKNELKINLSSFKFNDSRDYKLEKECIDKFKIYTDCDLIRYEETFKRTSRIKSI